MTRDGRLGDKLGPRLVSLLAQATIAARRGLAPHEARVQQAALQALIDRAGHEIGDLYAPIIAELLRDHGDKVHPHVAEFLGRAASGTHQWQAIAGLAASGAGGSFGDVFANALAPIVYAINRAGPNLMLTAEQNAAAVAAGVLTPGSGQYSAASQGISAGHFRTLVELAAQVPDLGSLQQAVNRGLITESSARGWLNRAGIPPELRGPLLALRSQELSPADLALAVLRGDLSEAEGTRLASLTGLAPAAFRVLLDNTGEPLGLMQLAEALRRGFIDTARFARGVRQSRVRNEWLDVAEKLRYGPVPTADAVDAALRGHIAWSQAQQIAAQNGIEPGEFSILQANAGSPPAPEQLLELWRRGKIDQARVDEGLRFGRLRNDWIPDVLHLRYERLTTADAIDAWLRGHISEQQARGIAEENGLDPADVPAALANAGNPLGLGQLLEAYRRGFITEPQFARGFRESRYRNEWAATALRLRYSPMSTADAVAAAVQGHIPIAEAKRLTTENGLDPADFTALYETAGDPLSRTELEQLYNRGLVSLAAVEQGLRESRLKDKYVKDAVALHVRLPEPRQIIAALTEGVLTRERAIRLLADHGFAYEDITWLIASAEVRSTGPHRELMAGQIARLYADHIIGHAEAVTMLRQVHYTATVADLILRVADYQAQQRIIDSGIGAVRSHYLAGRISEAAALGDLHALGLPASAADGYMRVWRVDKLAHPRQLTEAQIVKAHKLGLFTPPGLAGTPDGKAVNDAVAADRLVALGYDSTDAGLLLAGA